MGGSRTRPKNYLKNYLSFGSSILAAKLPLACFQIAPVIESAGNLARHRESPT